jgi:polyisoprenoid-binding protein YceI
MTKFILLFITLGALAGHTYAQRLLEKSGKVTFYSEAPVENIEAKNQQVLAIIDPGTGEVAVTMLMKGFQFRKSLMQEHFNESYVESDKYPKATFKGKILEYTPAVLKQAGTVEVEGEITIHGVTKPLRTKVTFTPGSDHLLAESTFSVKVADHEIKIPSVVMNNIAEIVEVSLSLSFTSQ